jgi:hypothetical protein
MALKRLFLCFNYVFLCFSTQLLALLCRLSPFFGVVYIQNRPRWRLCVVICAIWSWVSRPPAWWLRALLWIMMFCNEEVTGACACQTVKLAN